MRYEREILEIVPQVQSYSGGLAVLTREFRFVFLFFFSSPCFLYAGVVGIVMCDEFPSSFPVAHRVGYSGGKRREEKCNYVPKARDNLKSHQNRRNPEFSTHAAVVLVFGHTARATGHYVGGRVIMTAPGFFRPIKLS